MLEWKVLRMRIDWPEEGRDLGAHEEGLAILAYEKQDRLWKKNGGFFRKNGKKHAK